MMEIVGAALCALTGIVLYISWRTRKPKPLLYEAPDSKGQ